MSDIFRKYDLHTYINDQGERLATEIDGLEFTQDFSQSEVTQNFLDTYMLKPLKLNEPAPRGNFRETTQQIQGSLGRPLNQKVIETFMRMTFEGSGELFYCKPFYSRVVNPEFTVFDPYHNYIDFSVRLTEMQPKLFQAEVNRIFDDWNSNIPAINSQIASWNSDLPAFIERALSRRKDFVDRRSTFLEQIGLKVNPASDTYMVPPPVAKKTIPKPVAEVATPVSTKSGPTLSDDVYTDIKEVLFNVGRAIERKPSLYTGRSEEDLRDMFLLFLETRYEATAGVGEAFNKKGKTDILLKYAPDGTNLFIAECKFWKGAKKFHETIDQLFGYLTTRDSKAAVMMFVNQKELQAITETVKEEISNHPQFKRYIRDTYDSSIAYEFSLPDDSQKIIQIEVMLFHFPKTAVVKQ